MLLLTKFLMELLWKLVMVMLGFFMFGKSKKILKLKRYDLETGEAIEEFVSRKVAIPIKQ